MEGAGGKRTCCICWCSPALCSPREDIVGEGGVGAGWRMEHGRIPRNPSHKVPVCAMLSRASVVVREKRDGNFPQTDSSLQRERERARELGDTTTDIHTLLNTHTRRTESVSHTHTHHFEMSCRIARGREERGGRRRGYSEVPPRLIYTLSHTL